MLETLSDNDLKIILTVLGFLVTIISIGLGVQWRYYKNKIENREDKHEVEIKRLEAKYEQECIELKKGHSEESEKLKKQLDEELTLKQKEIDKSNIPIRQEVKMVYVKYLHIQPSKLPPVYNKYIKRLDKEVPIQSEYLYYRFNKYNKENNDITIKDSSTGVVDLNILHPWKDTVFNSRPDKANPTTVAQNLSGSDVYYSVTNYLNGFKENAEDIGARMEMDTDVVRILADFSSIVGYEKLFKKFPDAYKYTGMEKEGQKPIKISGVQEITKGVFYLEYRNLKKGEAVLLDFHVNWDYLEK